MARELPPAKTEVGEKATRGVRPCLLGATRPRRRRTQPPQEPGAHEEGEAVDADRPARTQGGHEQPAGGRTERDRPALHEPLERIRLLQSTGADDLGDEAGVGGAEERVAHAHADLQDEQYGHRRDIAEEKPGHRERQRHAHEVGGQHDLAALETVGPHAADGDRQRHGQDVRRLHDADVGGRTADLQHREGQGDHGQHRPGDGDGLADEELAELGFAKRGEVVAEGAHRHILSTRHGGGPAAPRRRLTRRAAAGARATPVSTSSSSRAGAWPPAP